MINELKITSVNAEEPNVVILTITVSRADVDAAQERAYLRKKSSIDVPGMRKGKASRKMIERLNGNDYFLEDAINELIPSVIEEVKENGAVKYLDIIDNFEIIQASSDLDLIFTVQAVLEPEVKLGQYKGLRYKKKDASVSDSELAKQIEKDRKRKATTKKVDRPVQKGDEIVLDFKGFVDGVPFEGGEAKDYNLVVGSNTFIPGFEEQLIGVEISKPVKINVVFPENYHADNLKGKPAVFECTVQTIWEKVLPELDDAFAKSLDYESLDAYKNATREKLANIKKNAVFEQTKNMLLKMASANADLHVPSMLVSRKAKNEMDDIMYKLSREGISLEMFCQNIGKKEEDLMNEVNEIAREYLRINFVLNAIAEKENLFESKEEVEIEAEKLAESYGMTVENVKQAIGESGLTNLGEEVRRNKAIDLIINSAIAE